MFKQKQAQKANVPYNLPAPIGGLDGISALMGMPENRCLLLENWFPQPDGLEMRDGYVSHMTGAVNPILNLHSYNSSTGAETLWAVSNSGIFPATSAGAFGAASIALTNGQTISTIISTGAGNYMMVANGVDTVKQYDGTSWTSIATFGAHASSNFSYVENYRQRLFLVWKNSLQLEYLAPNAISGAGTTYPLGAVFKRGGFIIAIGTWTLDGGTGTDDQLAIVTNKGEVAVFAGSDPATWTPRGVYTIPEPIGANCLAKYGGDLLVLTEDGIFPMSTVVQSVAVDRNTSISATVKSFFRAAAVSFKTTYGWQIYADPLKPFLLVSIPATPVRYQLVMNTQTRAWTIFKGWDARCFGRINRETYFGTTTAVKRVNGNSDEGTNITATMIQAYSRFRMSRTKKVELQKAYISANNGFTYGLGAGIDFADPREETYISGAAYANAALWGTAIFGQATFTGQTTIYQDWQTIPDDFSLWKAPYLQVVSRSAKVKYFGSDYLLVPGSGL